MSDAQGIQMRGHGAWEEEKEKRSKIKISRDSRTVAAEAPGASIVIGGFSFSERSRVKWTVAEMYRLSRQMLVSPEGPAAECFFSFLLICGR